MRLFVAVRPPTAVLESLAETLGREVDDRWHLTLAFLGEQPGPEAFRDPLADVAAHQPPLVLSLTGGQTFGGRVLSAAVTGDVPALQELALHVRDACRSAGADIEDRRFRPHLTLARGRGLSVPAALAAYQGPPWVVEGFDLVHSRLGRRAEHAVLNSFPLGGFRTQ
ncbi:MAG: 2-5 ligase [Frankiales bacterium]|nr:2-5 ligase [Frankiales bacterium]